MQEFWGGEALLVGIGADEAGEDVGCGVAGVGAAAGDEGFEVGEEASDGLVAALEVFGGEAWFEGTEDGEGPVAEGGAFVGGYGEEVADDLDGDGGGVVFDEVGGFEGGEAIEQVVDGEDEAGLHLGDGAGGEGRGDEAADAGVEGWVVEDEAGGVVFVERGVAEFGAEFLALVGAVGFGVAVDLGAVVVAGEEDAAVGEGVDGGVFAEGFVGGVWIIVEGGREGGEVEACGGLAGSRGQFFDFGEIVDEGGPFAGFGFLVGEAEEVAGVDGDESLDCCRRGGWGGRARG